MKHFPFSFLVVIFFAASLFAQTDNKSKTNDPVPLLRSSALQTGCSEQLISILTDGLKSEPKNEYLLLARAECYKELNNPEFLKDIPTVIKLNPNFDNSFYYRLTNLILSKEPKESQANLNYLKAAIPNHWFLYTISAAIEKEQSDFPGAIDEYLKAVELMPYTRTSLLWQPVFAIESALTDQDAFRLYERFYSAFQKRQSELSIKMKNLSSDSEEFRAVRKDFERSSGYLPSLCFKWATRARKSGNSQMENAALEKMVQTEPRWLGYDLRSNYYKQNGNKEKALPDKIKSLELQILSKQEEIKQTPSLDKELNINRLICDIYVRMGDLFFENEQYVKAIDNYNKAKPFYRYQDVLDRKINWAVQRLNISTQQPK